MADSSGATDKQCNTKMQAPEIGIYEFTDKCQTHAAYLKENVSTIMNQKHQCSNAMEVAHPWECHKAYCGYVMYKHLPEILPLNIKELWYGQWPIKCQWEHVIPPAVWSDALVQIK